MNAKIISVMTAAVLALSLAGCSGKKDKDKDSSEKKLTVDEKLAADEKNKVMNGYIIINSENDYPDEIKELRFVTAGSEENSYNVSDISGNVLFTFTSESSVTPYYTEGMAPFEKDGLWGFVDINGKVVADPRFDSVGDFNNGSCPVTFGGEEYFIDKDGNVTEDKRYEGMSVNEEDIKAKMHNEKLSLYRFTGKYARVAMDAGGSTLYGYCDKNGEVQMFSDYTAAYDFNNGYALVTVGGETYFIDEDFNRVTGDLTADGFGQTPCFFASTNKSTQYIFSEGYLVANESTDGVPKTSVVKLTPENYSKS